MHTQVVHSFILDGRVSRDINDLLATVPYLVLAVPLFLCLRATVIWQLLHIAGVWCALALHHYPIM